MDASSDPNARTWAMFAHLSSLAGYLIPFGNLIGPLIIWQIKKEVSPFVDDQGREALNFQLTVTLAGILCVILAFLLVGFFLFWILGIGALVFVIIAAIKANQGTAYRYPLCIRFLK